MHGRFLLPTVVLLTLASAGLCDRLFDSRKIMSMAVIVMVVGLTVISQLVIPVQKKIGASPFGHHGITDERNFYFADHRIPLKNLFGDHYIIMWKTMGENYRHLSQSVRKNIRIAYPVVGFLGYYSGKHVFVLDKLGLTDRVVSRQKTLQRGRPGHEKSAPFGYLVYRRLTFGETPHPLWNNAARTPYGILWDLSPQTLNRFSFFLGQRFKPDLDQAVVSFLMNLDENSLREHADFMFFLKTFWAGNAPAEGRALFNRMYSSEIEKHAASYLWIQSHQQMINEMDSHIRGKLTPRKFFSNIRFALGMH